MRQFNLTPMPTSYQLVLLRYLQAEEVRLRDPAFGERCDAILAEFDQAAENGVQPNPWLIRAAQMLHDELGAQITRRHRLMAELGRWVAPPGKN
jgi:hypothetical protein